jgi:riboflavin kinase/FMN adenylyltransferase
MEVIRDLAACTGVDGGCVVTIGAYDGVHLGHRALITEVRQRAERLGCRTAVVTFDRHPASIVRPDSAPKLLTDLDQKLELLAAAGVDVTLVVHFDEERSKESAEDFVQTVLVGCLNAKAVVVGHDFHFGHDRRGNVALLTQMGGELGFDVLGLRLVEDDQQHQAVSSTRIRALLSAGDVQAAAHLLGRAHEVRGIVQLGDRRGRELGFATANVAVPSEILLPADGIYAGWFVRADGSVLSAAISLGRRPTFYEDAEASLLEAHVLDFEGDLYGEAVAVRFIAKLRDEARFDDVEALIEQMERDVTATREALKSFPST